MTVCSWNPTVSTIMYIARWRQVFVSDGWKFVEIEHFLHIAKNCLYLNPKMIPKLLLTVMIALDLYLGVALMLFKINIKVPQFAQFGVDFKRCLPIFVLFSFLINLLVTSTSKMFRNVASNFVVIYDIYMYHFLVVFLNPLKSWHHCIQFLFFSNKR